MQTKLKRLETLRNEVEKAFDGEFMQPEFWVGTHTRYVTQPEGELHYVPMEYYIPEDNHDDVENIFGYGARLSAAGYMDSTEWCVFKTEREALQYLLDTYAN